MTSLADLRWPEVSGDALLVIPLGSTEQHGPHLPLSTDTDIARSLAELLAARCPGTVVAPPVPYGASGEHADFPGTLSIGTDALQQLIVELVRSAARTFRRVLLVNGHGGNADAVASAVAQLQAERHDVRVWSPRWRGDAHAGRTETSVQLARGTSVLELPVGAVEPLVQLLPRLRAEGVRAVSGNGVLGDASAATADEGSTLLAAAVADLETFVAAW